MGGTSRPDPSTGLSPPGYRGASAADMHRPTSHAHVAFLSHTPTQHAHTRVAGGLVRSLLLFSLPPGSGTESQRSGMMIQPLRGDSQGHHVGILYPAGVAQLTPSSAERSEPKPSGVHQLDPETGGRTCSSSRNREVRRLGNWLSNKLEQEEVIFPHPLPAFFAPRGRWFSPQAHNASAGPIQPPSSPCRQSWESRRGYVRSPQRINFFFS